MGKLGLLLLLLLPQLLPLLLPFPPPASSHALQQPLVSGMQQNSWSRVKGRGEISVNRFSAIGGHGGRGGGARGGGGGRAEGRANAGNDNNGDSSHSSSVIPIYAAGATHPRNYHQSHKGVATPGAHQDMLARRC
ncbi:uncharacterized protein LOC131148631 isoform X2 [Malania oleifera]|uniref:uncharacterized protein LOC131148631 isoform X2 n=1 Tax=Malania oleifera TaxID=397392 RepID=UPI0025AE0AC0|nr:uncharacterized protein LOC131148631 isoform X2 [Malania oleifera]